MSVTYAATKAVVRSKVYSFLHIETKAIALVMLLVI